MTKVIKDSQRLLVTKDGDVLKGKMIEALAAEAEAGYDLSKARPQRVSRPSLGSGVSPRVSFRASALYHAARERAAKEGRTASDLARSAMERYITDQAEGSNS